MPFGSAMELRDLQNSASPAPSETSVAEAGSFLEPEAGSPKWISLQLSSKTRVVPARRRSEATWISIQTSNKTRQGPLRHVHRVECRPQCVDGQGVCALADAKPTCLCGEHFTGPTCADPVPEAAPARLPMLWRGWEAARQAPGPPAVIKLMFGGVLLVAIWLFCQLRHWAGSKQERRCNRVPLPALIDRARLFEQQRQRARAELAQRAATAGWALEEERRRGRA